MSSVSSAQVAPASPTARVKWLAAPSSAAWLEQAIAHPDLVLLDHALCERKAASTALQLLFRYPADEELEHFERVLALMRQRGIALKPLPAPPYGSSLVALVRRQDPERKLDSFLVAGLIEARSHERMALLAAHSPDPELRQLYGDLLASEARHFGLYWVLCEARFPRAQVVERLEQLAEAEAAILAPLHPQPRMHS